MVGKTQSWIEFWISISSKSLKLFLLYLCLENPRLIFHFLHHFFLLYKPQILTKQIGLTNCLVIPPKNLCSCVQTIKSKHDGGAHVVFFVVACYSWHSEIPHSWKNIYREMKRNYQPEKTIHCKKKTPKNVTSEEKRSLFCYFADFE